MRRLKQTALRLLLRAILAPVMLLLSTSAAGGFGWRAIDPRKIAVYIRWSTDDQGNGTTLDVQRDACINQARAWGLGTVPDDHIFVDDGYSGSDLDRPAITRIRELVRTGQVECVIVYKLDRLSRNIVDAVNLVLREWDGVCQLKCVMEPVDTTTELGRMIFSILAMFADFERSAIRSRTWGGKIRRAAEGRNPGYVLPYGYRKGSTPGEILVDPEAATVILEIFEQYASGVGMPHIAHRLNERGIPGIRSKHWSASSVQYILANETYTGTLVFGRTRRNERHGRTDGQAARIASDEPLAVARDALPVIIPQELFDRCAAVRLGRRDAVQRTGGRAISSDHLLTGIARCTCGRLLQGRFGGNRARTPYYICPVRWLKGPVVCDAAWVPQDTLDRLVTEQILDLRRPERREQIRQRYAAGLLAQVDGLRTQLARTDHEIADLDMQEVRVRRDYRTGALSAPEFETTRADIQRERQEQISARQRLTTELATAEAEAADATGWLRTIDRLDDWDRMTTVERKEILRRLIQTLTVRLDRDSGLLQFELVEESL